MGKTKQEGYGHEYPPADWTRAELRAAFADTEPSSPVPTYEDESFWLAVRETPSFEPWVERVLDAAAGYAKEDPPPVRASSYLQFERTGQRGEYAGPVRERGRRLTAFTLAECLEREGTYLDDALDEAWALCELTAWKPPANEHGQGGLPVYAADDERFLALNDTKRATTLAEVDWVLGSRLHEDLGARIGRELDARILTPYLANDDYWWLERTNNWNAVCNGNVVMTALYVEDDPDRLAQIVHKAVGSLDRFLAGFDGDGAAGEGIGYVDYGLGEYVRAAAQLEARLGREYSLLSPPIVPEIARFPIRARLSPGRYPPFADSNERIDLSPATYCYLGERLGDAELRRFGVHLFLSGAREGSEPIPYSLQKPLRTLLWCRRATPDGSARDPTPPRRAYFEGFEWWVVRNDPTDPDGVVIAAKGGDNAESHSHADCGSFVVHANGETLLADLGKPATYPSTYFGPDRYTDYLEARSLGHSVPYVNGCEQGGHYMTDDDRTYPAAVLDRTTADDRETFTLDLADSYPDAAGLAALERQFVFERGTTPTLTVTDEATFEPDAPGQQLTSVLVSRAPIESATGDGDGADIVVTGDRGRATVAVDPAEATVDVELLVDELVSGGDDWEDTGDGEQDDSSTATQVWRARVTPPDESVTLRIQPDSH